MDFFPVLLGQVGLFFATIIFVFYVLSKSPWIGPLVAWMVRSKYKEIIRDDDVDESSRSIAKYLYQKKIAFRLNLQLTTPGTRTVIASLLQHYNFTRAEIEALGDTIKEGPTGEQYYISHMDAKKMLLLPLAFFIFCYIWGYFVRDGADSSLKVLLSLNFLSALIAVVIGVYRLSAFKSALKKLKDKPWLFPANLKLSEKGDKKEVSQSDDVKS